MPLYRFTYLLQLLLKQNLVLPGRQLEFPLFDAIVASSLGQESETKPWFKNLFERTSNWLSNRFVVYLQLNGVFFVLLVWSEAPKRYINSQPISRA